jgi:hypothetical protein
MTRRPDFGKREDAMNAEDIKALNESLSRLSQPAILDFYQSAYRLPDCEQRHIPLGPICPAARPGVEAVAEVAQALKCHPYPDFACGKTPFLEIYFHLYFNELGGS